MPDYIYNQVTKRSTLCGEVLRDSNTLLSADIIVDVIFQHHEVSRLLF